MGVKKIAAAFLSGVFVVLLACPVIAERSTNNESESSSHPMNLSGDSQETPTGSITSSENTTLIHNSVNGNQGIVSVNQNSGGLNNQSNLRAFGFGVDTDSLEEAHSAVHARIEGNKLKIPETTRTDIISESVTGNVGVIGINQAAGYGNNQSNVLVFTLGAAVALSEAELTAVSTNNNYSAPKSPGNRLDSISDSFTNTQGIVQVTQSAGDGNVLGNRIGISFSTEVLR
jgi:hypothetical protein